MTFTFSSTQRNDLLTVINAALAAYSLDNEGTNIFNDAYSAVYAATTIDDLPISGISTDVAEWVKGATGVNNNTTAFGAFIRDYTSFQHEIRTGDGLTSAELQAASNLVASNFLTDLLDRLLDSNPANWTMPTLSEIGEHDAGAAASANFNGNYSAWAGTLLFPYLGDDSYFYDLLLDIETSPIKLETGTYELVASLQSSIQAVENNVLALMLSIFDRPEYNSTTIISDTTSFFLNAYGLGTNTVYNPGADLVFTLDGGLFANHTYIAGLITDNTEISPLEVTVDITKYNSAIVNAGSGDDFIVMAEEATLPTYALVDGGPGDDTADYSYVIASSLPPQGLNLTLSSFDGDLYDIGFIMTDSYLMQHHLFGIENIVMTGNDDTFTIDEGFLSSSAVFQVFGGDESIDGDTIDLSNHTSGVSIYFDEALDTVTATISNTTIEFYDFENITGSSGNDTITGSLGVDSNILSIDGHGGYDVLDLSGTTDPTVFQYFQPGVISVSDDVNYLWIDTEISGIEEYYLGSNIDIFVVYGTEEEIKFVDAGGPTFSFETYIHDILVFMGSGLDAFVDLVNGIVTYGDCEFEISNFEEILGGDGNDTMYGGNQAVGLSGGAGDDLIFAGDGTTIIMGGDGNDTIYGNVGGETLNGDEGNDVIYAGPAGVESTRIFGGNGNDTLYGNGNSIITGGAGADTYYLYSGDTIIWDNLTLSDTIILNDTTLVTDTFDDIFDLAGSNPLFSGYDNGLWVGWYL